MLPRILKAFLYWIEPKCDLCGERAKHNNHLQSDGGILAHMKCWDKINVL